MLDIPNYHGAYICETEKDFICCQNFFIKKGYHWYTKISDTKISGSKKQYFKYHDLFGTDEYRKIVLFLKDNNLFGWTLYKSDDDFFNEINIELTHFSCRKEKIKQLLYNV